MSIFLKGKVSTMKFRILKKGVSSLLAILLAFELIPVQAYATDSSYDQTEETAVYDCPDGYFSFDENDAVVSDKPSLTEEITDRRDEFQKEFMMENGMRLAAIYPMAVHFEREGKWEEIDNTLYSDNFEEEKVFRNKNGIWNVYLPTEIGENRDIILEHNGHRLSFGFLGELGKEAYKETSVDEVESVETVEDETEVTEPPNETAEDNDEQEQTIEAEEAAPSDGEDASALNEDTEITAETTDGVSNEEAITTDEAPLEDVTEVPTAENTDEETGKTSDAADEVLPDEEVISANYGYEINPVKTSKGTLLESEIKDTLNHGSLEEDILSRISSGIRYDGVFEGTDLKYELISNQLKETVIINSFRDDLTGYRYAIKTKDLVLKAEENGMIIAYPKDGSEPAFYLPAPFLYDSEHRMNRDIKTELEETEDGYTLTYILPKEWLSDPETKYPVSLDPVIQPVSSTYTIQDQSVSEFHNLDYTWGCVEAGYFPPSSGGGGRERIFMKFQNIPSLSAADVIVSASVSMYKPYDRPTVTIEAHQVNATWDSTTITWSNMPSTNSLIEDYAVTHDPGWYTWDITNIAQNWYANNLNSGVMFKVPDSIENGGTQVFDQYYSSDYSPSYAPILKIAYVNNCGIENTWDYVETSAGRAGTGYVNAYTGNLVWINQGLGFSGTRMPVSIQHIYNANDYNNNSFGLGYGWRTNYNQLVYQWSVNSNYYVWEDSDGTRQYFLYKSSGVYENELDSTLKLTTTGSGTTKYCITDSKNNKSYFDTYGRLTKISNNQQTVSNITVTYSGTSKYITYVTDGAGRKYQFSYNGTDLQKINFLGTGSTVLDYTEYTQYFNELWSVKYSDAKIVYFSYGMNHLLSEVSDVDHSGAILTYTRRETGVPNRIAGVYQQGSDYSVGNFIRFTYTKNQTVLKDNHDNIRILQFNNWGSTTCVMNDMGQAVASRYVNSNSGTTDNRKTGSQLSLTSKLQDTVTNLMINGSFEYGTYYWYDTPLSTGEGVIDVVNTPYLGEKSLSLTQTGTGTPGTFILRNTDSVSRAAVPGEVYTLSAYIKVTDITSGGGGAFVCVESYDNYSILAKSEVITEQTDDWTRVEATMVMPDDLTDQSVKICLHMDSFGTALFDCVQFEKSATAGRFNLLDNSTFSFPLNTSTEATYWSRGDSSASSTEIRYFMTENVQTLGSDAIRIVGSPTSAKSFYQNVHQSGAAGDVYTFGGWAKADSVPLKDSRRFNILVRFNNTDGTTTDAVAKFNPWVGNGNDWQYVAGKAVSTKPYSSMRVFLMYNYNANTAYFDGIQLFKEEFGESYTYDSDGNITSVKDLHQKTTQYQYANNNLTKIIHPDNVQETYTYDNYHNVLTATTPEGVLTSFTYDAYGNNTGVNQGSGTKKVKVSASYSADGNQLSSLTDPEGNTTYYGYNTQTGTLDWVREPGESDSTRTNYTYDAINRLTGASRGGDQVSYAYNGSDLLSSITSPSGTTYGYAYDALCHLTGISIGANSIVTNSYDSTTHYLSSSVFGNGDSVSYTYDSFGRIKTAAYEDNASMHYDYNTEGDVGLVRYGDETIRYYYDFQGEIRGIDTKDGNDLNSVRWTYDTKNNLTKTVHKLNGTEYSTDYTYDNDNRVTSQAEGNIGTEYTYSDFNAISEIKSKNGSTTVVDSQIDFLEPDSSSVSYKTSKWKNVYGNQNTEYNYTFDPRGNITSISDGTNTSSYVYDSKDQLTRENNEGAGKTWVYTYDDGGNITSKKEYSYTTGTLGTPVSTKNYTYGDTAWPDKLTALNGNTLSYDSVGNLTGDGEWTYSWQHGSQLSGMTKTGTNLSYEYNYEGLRTAKTVNGLTTKYFYTGDSLTDIIKGSDSMHFTYDAVGPSSVTYNGTTYYYLRNAQEDVVGIVDSSGALVVSYTYDAWGEQLAISGSLASTLGVDNPFRYRGYIYDEETGIFYLNSRYYDPEIERFISVDSPAVPTISPEKTNWDKNIYAYCDNNPISRKDSDGNVWLQAMLIGGLIGAGIGAATSIITQSIFEGEVKWRTVLVDLATGFVGGAIAASPLGMAWQVYFGAAINAISYNVDCYVNNQQATDGGTIAAIVGGIVSVGIGGKGPNSDYEIDNIVDKSKKIIARETRRKNQEYAVKNTARTKNYIKTIKTYTTAKAAYKFTVGSIASKVVGYGYAKAIRSTK